MYLRAVRSVCIASTVLGGSPIGSPGRKGAASVGATTSGGKDYVLKRVNSVWLLEHINRVMGAGAQGGSP